MTERDAMLMVTEGNITYFIYGTTLPNATRRNSLTSYPTVEGTSFSDHYYREPESVSFQLRASDLTGSLIYRHQKSDSGEDIQYSLTREEVEALVERWFRDATRLGITSPRHVFVDMILEQYSWSDQALGLFAPTLSFKEARVQRLRTATINNPSVYFQAAYGEVISVGGAATVETPVNVGSALGAGVGGAAIGAMVGSLIPGLGTVAGALIGAGIGFFGNLLGLG